MTANESIFLYLRRKKKKKKKEGDKANFLEFFAVSFIRSLLYAQR